MEDKASSIAPHTLAALIPLQDAPIPIQLSPIVPANAERMAQAQLSPMCHIRDLEAFSGSWLRSN